MDGSSRLVGLLAVVGLTACGTIEPIQSSAVIPDENAEVCDAADNDDDGMVDEGIAGCCIPGDQRNCGPDAVGTCKPGTTHCDTQGAWGPCEGAIEPTDDLCDDLDNDCDNLVDENNTGCCTPATQRACGPPAVGPCQPGNQICDDQGEWGSCDGAIFGTAEVCDGIDNNCSGAIDEPFDLDGDGSANKFVPECFAAANLSLDCNDNDAQIQSGCKYYVATPGAGAQSGNSWANARSDLRALLDVGLPGETYWVAKGTYIPAATDRSKSFTIPSSVTVLGGFDGVANDGSRDPVANPTTLSGDLSGNDYLTSLSGNDENSYHVVRSSGSNAQTHLDGFVIRGGNANQSGDEAIGGGLLLEDSNLAIVDCVIEYNYAASAGGGVAIRGGAPSVTKSLFYRNESETQGGAIYSDGSSALIDRCTLDKNRSFDGSGVYDSGAMLIVSSLIADGHRQGPETKAVYVEGSAQTTLINVTVAGNKGHGIYNGALTGLLTVYNSISGRNEKNQLVTLGGATTDIQYSATLSEPHAGTGNISTSVNFVSSSEGNYRLTGGGTNKAIDGGNNGYLVSGMNEDPDGIDRIVNGTVDMGCYEQ